jgi:biotin transport system substrate-specific component
MLAEMTGRRYPLALIRVLRFGFFVALLAIAAKIRFVLPDTPVPITMQTLAVFLTGMALGPAEGALSVAGYVAAIAGGLPLDTYGLGPAVFAGPTAGYLLGFIPAAFVAGLAWRVSERYKLILSIACGLAAAILILAAGTLGVAIFRQIVWWDALLLGLFPFMLVEPGKVLLAASLVKLGRESWLRWIAPYTAGYPLTKL